MTEPKLDEKGLEKAADALAKAVNEGKFARASAKATVRAYLAALAAPEGWKMVPVEPTREMWEAMGDALVRRVAAGHLHHDALAESAWTAALAAAPPPPSPRSDGEAG